MLSPKSFLLSEQIPTLVAATLGLETRVFFAGAGAPAPSSTSKS